ncbi:MAG: class I SAM-dependent methyltransferase [Oscillospiraceae bacterium]
MEPIVLTDRLQAVAKEIPQGAHMADVGTDHGYLPTWLIQTGRVERLIASDLRQAPLERARRNVQKHEVADRVDLRLCDGLAGIRPDEVDTVVIAGMGGEIIAKILAAAPWTKACRCILQPMSSHPDLRRWLWSNGYQITLEQLVREGKVLYTVLTATGGESGPFSPAECWAGKQRQGDDAPLRHEYLTRRIRQAEIECAGLARSKIASDRDRLPERQEIRAALIKLQEEWDSWQQ